MKRQIHLQLLYSLYQEEYPGQYNKKDYSERYSPFLLFLQFPNSNDSPSSIRLAPNAGLLARVKQLPPSRFQWFSIRNKSDSCIHTLTAAGPHGIFTHFPLSRDMVAEHKCSYYLAYRLILPLATLLVKHLNKFYL